MSKTYLTKAATEVLLGLPSETLKAVTNALKSLETSVPADLDRHQISVRGTPGGTTYSVRIGGVRIIYRENPDNDCNEVLAIRHHIDLLSEFPVLAELPAEESTVRPPSRVKGKQAIAAMSPEWGEVVGLSGTSLVSGIVLNRERVRKPVRRFVSHSWRVHPRVFRPASVSVIKALYCYQIDYRRTKASFRRAWIARINAAARKEGIAYRTLMVGLHQAGIKLNRKVLADMSLKDSSGFAELVSTAKEHLKKP